MREAGLEDDFDPQVPSVVELCESFLQPAALARLSRDGRFRSWSAKSPALTPSQREALERIADFQRSSTIEAGGVKWSVTLLQRHRYAFFIGSSVETDKSNESCKANSQSSRRSPEEWFSIFKSIEVPGLPDKERLAHIDLFRHVDWTKTILGSMDTWSTTLWTKIGHALASPTSVALAWGSDLICK